MFKLLFPVFLGLGLVLAQVPYGSGLDKNTQILVFTAPNCSACAELAKASGLLITFVGRADTLPYAPYRKDVGDVLARSFRIQQAPTVVVIKDGWEVKRFVGTVPDAKLLALAVQATDAGLLTPTYTMPLKLGSTAPEPYQNYTGLLIFGRETCHFCEQEKDSWAAMCHNKLPVRLVYSEGKWPEACSGEVNADLFPKFGIPGTPTHVYLKAGRVMWIDVGYRNDLAELVQALGSMEVK